jgi:hypothetical protein
VTPGFFTALGLLVSIAVSVYLNVRAENRHRDLESQVAGRQKRINELVVEHARLFNENKQLTLIRDDLLARKRIIPKKNAKRGRR